MKPVRKEKDAEKKSRKVWADWLMAAFVLVAGSAFVYLETTGRRRSGMPPAMAKNFEGKPIVAAPGGRAVTPQTGAAHNGPSLPAGVDPLAGRTLEGEGPFELGFDVLAAYPYQQPREIKVPAGQTAPDQIPAGIRNLAGKKITVKGYMMPVTSKDGRVSELLLLRNQPDCCYGVTPSTNEWIVVRFAPGDSVERKDLVPVSVTGEMEVGEVWQDGWVSSLYRLNNSVVTAVEQE
jgi:hypothetical protein